eukprot:TRINITY_DN53770_c0_g1_i1.p1 TRINITY_DN53770_c0_g1~~TRINITY_DN53770_c0_g1_i1.p1  ORF type:complete len:498 (-),score=278.69 TRINITY_DN53770_c0_g1_i1:52-1491(-)
MGGRTPLNLIRIAVLVAAMSIAISGVLADPAPASALQEGGEEEGGGDEKISPHDAQFWVYVGVCFGLVSMGGVMSGLTVGLFSLDPLKLSLLKRDRESSDEDKRRAALIAPILKEHHRLLVTLLIANAAAMEALPIFLDRLVPSYVAIILSVTFVLIFGEIIPQALCTSDPLKIGARFVPVVKVFMFLLYPLSYPIAKLLDYLLGHEGSHFLFRRSELEALVDVHAKETSAHGNLSIDEVLILKGTLSLQRKTVADCLTPIDRVFMLDSRAILDKNTIADVMASGHSRVPMYRGSRNNVQGLVLVKRLVMIRPEDRRAVKDFAVRRPIVVPPHFRMFDMLNEFQLGKSHMALVSPHYEIVRQCLRTRQDVPAYVRLEGIITLEDVLEELIQEEIEDETDEVIHKSMDAQVRNEMMVHKATLKFKALAARARRRVRDRHLSQDLNIEVTKHGVQTHSDPSNSGGHKYSLLVEVPESKDDH